MAIVAGFALQSFDSLFRVAYKSSATKPAPILTFAFWKYMHIRNFSFTSHFLICETNGYEDRNSIREEGP